jgi:hypothetical protein
MAQWRSIQKLDLQDLPKNFENFVIKIPPKEAPISTPIYLAPKNLVTF